MSQSKSDTSARSYQQAYKRAIKMLSVRSRSTFEVACDLRGKGFSDHVVGQVTEELAEKGWINDEELARSIVSNAQRCNKGWTKIYKILRSRGFDRHDAEEALSSFYDLQKEEESINFLVSERLASLSTAPGTSETEKIIMAISNRGFPPLRIRRSLESLMDERYG
jgi:regulatory protein